MSRIELNNLTTQRLKTNLKGYKGATWAFVLLLAVLVGNNLLSFLTADHFVWNSTTVTLCASLTVLTPLLWCHTLRLQMELSERLK